MDGGQPSDTPAKLSSSRVVFIPGSTFLMGSNDRYPATVQPREWLSRTMPRPVGRRLIRQTAAVRKASTSQQLAAASNVPRVNFN
jgi:hypothetical protein